MKTITLEEALPCRVLALLVLVLFYGIYFGKAMVQKRKGIQTRQIGRRKEKNIHTVELLMSAATLLAAFLTARCKKKWLAPLPPVLANMVLVGLVLSYEQAGTSAAFWPAYAFNALTVGAGELVACYGLGLLLLWRLEKSKALQNYLQNR